MTTTTRYGMHLPASDGSDLVNVSTDLIGPLQTIDAEMGFPVTTALASNPASGKTTAVSAAGPVYRTYFSNGTAPASASWVELLNSSGTFGSNIKLGSTQQLVIGSDVNLFRDAANVLRTNDSLTVDLNLSVAGSGQVTGAVSVGGALTVTGNASVAGDLKLLAGTTVYRPKLSTQTTVANTVTETFLASMTIPANDAVVGAIYRIKAWGIFGVTGTPTLNIRNRLGGVAGSSWGQTGAQTIQSGVTNRLWMAEQVLTCEGTGASATWNGPLHVEMAGVLAGTAPFINDGAELTTAVDGTATITVDSTVSNTFGITATWSAASASNTILCKGFIAERVT